MYIFFYFQASSFYLYSWIEICYKYFSKKIIIKGKKKLQVSVTFSL